MKRLTIVLLLFSLVFCLCACTQDPQPECVFYYLRSQDNYSYGSEDGVLAPEIRELSLEEPLDYLLKLYLDGPLTDDLIFPYPEGTALVSLTLEEDTLTAVLTEQYAQLDSIRQTLAGICFSRTCFYLCDAQQLTIQSGEKTYTYSRSSFTTFDDSASQSVE